MRRHGCDPFRAGRPRDYKIYESNEKPKKKESDTFFFGDTGDKKSTPRSFSRVKY